MKTARKMNLQELKSLGREMARTRGKWGVIFLIGLVLFVIEFILGFWSEWATKVLGGSKEFFENGVHIISTIIQVTIGAMLIPLFLGWAKKEELGFRDFLAQFTKKTTWKNVDVIFLFSILAFWAGLLSIIGWTAAVTIAESRGIPFVIVKVGVILAGLFATFVAIWIWVRLLFVNMIIADKDCGIIEGLRHSWRITKGHFWKLIGFHFYFLLWNILGVLCLIIGVIWTSTMRNIAFSKLYLELSENEKDIEKSE